MCMKTSMREAVCRLTCVQNTICSRQLVMTGTVHLKSKHLVNQSINVRALSEQIYALMT